jgi:predicted RNA-binding Zn-ribbon protein involved in translation (DUF1610 family)
LAKQTAKEPEEEAGVEPNEDHELVPRRGGNEEQRVQRLIQLMVDKGIYSVTPKVEPTGISYSSVSELLSGEPDEEIRAFLDRLVKTGVFEAKIVDRVVTCPACRGSSIIAKYLCPRCSSFDIGRASIIEHVRCGYLDSKDKFEKGNALICPKCKGIVREADYRKIGTSFQCNACGSRFESPKMTHRCNTCEDEFTYKDAIYEPIYKYSISELTKRNAAKGTVPLISIVNILKDQGFHVGLKAELQGKSGATHSFDIVARKDKKLIVASFSFEPKEEDIISLFAKRYDIDPTLTFLITLTPASKEEEAVSKAYGVQILYATGAHSIGEQLMELLQQIRD